MSQANLSRKVSDINRQYTGFLNISELILSSVILICLLTSFSLMVASSLIKKNLEKFINFTIVATSITFSVKIVAQLFIGSSYAWAVGRIDNVPCSGIFKKCSQYFEYISKLTLTPDLYLKCLTIAILVIIFGSAATFTILILFYSYSDGKMSDLKELILVLLMVIFTLLAAIFTKMSLSAPTFFNIFVKTASSLVVMFVLEYIKVWS